MVFLIIFGATLLFVFLMVLFLYRSITYIVERNNKMIMPIITSALGLIVVTLIINLILRR